MQKLAEHTVFSLPGTNEKEWLEDMITDPEKSKTNIQEFIKSNKEKILSKAKTELMEAKIKNLQLRASMCK